MERPLKKTFSPSQTLQLALTRSEKREEMEANSSSPKAKLPATSQVCLDRGCCVICVTRQLPTRYGRQTPDLAQWGWGRSEPKQGDRIIPPPNGGRSPSLRESARDHQRYVLRCPWIYLSVLRKDGAREARSFLLAMSFFHGGPGVFCGAVDVIR